jgi:cation/acetate symporter
VIRDRAVDFHLFPLQNPGLVSIPLGFLLGWLGTVTSRERPDEARFAELELCALTGHHTDPPAPPPPVAVPAPPGAQLPEPT